MINIQPKILTMKVLGPYIKRIRVGAGLTQEYVADLIGEARTNYNRFENGFRGIAQEKIEKLVSIEAFGLTMDHIEAMLLIAKHGEDGAKRAAEIVLKMGKDNEKISSSIDSAGNSDC